MKNQIFPFRRSRSFLLPFLFTINRNGEMIKISFNSTPALSFK